MFFITKQRWLVIIVGLVGIMITLPVLAEPPMQQSSPNSKNILLITFFTDDVPLEIRDLAGNAVGEGMHIGVVRCGENNCARKTHLDVNLSQPLTDVVTLEYQFTTRQAIDPALRRAVVEGRGSISSSGQNERFSFTATFSDNGDGTVWVRYEASRPDASFVIPRAPATFEITSRP